MNRDEDQEASRALWRMAGLGTELAGAIAGMALLGWLLDGWWGTAPRGVLVCLLIGIVGGGYNFIRRATALNRNAAAAYRGSRRAHPGTDPGAGPGVGQAGGAGAGGPSPMARTGPGALEPRATGPRTSDQWFASEAIETQDEDADARDRP